MAEEKKFAQGLYPKKIDTKYGTMIKLGVKKDDFAKFVKQMEDEGYINDNGFLNLIIQESKEGKQYVAVDTFKPDKEKENQSGEEDQSDDLPF